MEKKEDNRIKVWKHISYLDLIWNFITWPWNKFGCPKNLDKQLNQPISHC